MSPLLTLLLGLLGLFPFSFLVFVISERVNATHQSRVGRGITFLQFFRQSCADLQFDLKANRERFFWLTMSLQLSIVLLLEFDFEWVVFAYLAINLFVLVATSPSGEEIEGRIESDRSQTKFFVASILAFLSALGVFAYSGSTSLAQVEWSPFYFIFVPIFQIAGMILFSEYPFKGLMNDSSWIRSARFYVWCMLSVKLFLGGNLAFFDGHLKAALLFVFCRLVAQYFPRYAQKDLYRLGLIYLVPLSIVLWLTTMLILGVARSGGANV